MVQGKIWITLTSAGASETSRGLHDWLMEEDQAHGDRYVSEVGTAVEHHALNLTNC